MHKFHTREIELNLKFRSSHDVEVRKVEYQLRCFPAYLKSVPARSDGIRICGCLYKGYQTENLKDEQASPPNTPVLLVLPDQLLP
ncbi:hypothetical protein TNIN_124561 [Trichonephila inaurata madagascariensis]|uniref:Uncharacterized protein n=1 Tax=Trichonephila inaurata madagascariensis TaxID=2747483 RepID=A0A8X6YY97_9ARAC|nr:hypothetical protein TNIN_124561 [Trichonephila inaurata madagascariensis]